MGERSERTRRNRSGRGLSRGHTAFSCVVGLNNPPRFFNPNHTGVNMFKKLGSKAKKAAVAVVSLVAAGAAMAEVPADVTAALTAAKADGATVAGAVLVVLVGIAVFKYMRRGV